MTARVPAGVPTGGRFAASARSESTVSLGSSTDGLTANDVVVGPGVGGECCVRTRADRASVGTVAPVAGPRGQKWWTPQALDGVALHYPVPGPDGAPTPRRYATRTAAVQALLNERNGANDPARWEHAPAYDWSATTYSHWGQRFAVAETLRDRPLLHGSPHDLEVGAILLPDTAPPNFSQSDPFVVSVTTEAYLATSWGREAAGDKPFHVYEVEPLTAVTLWQVDMGGWHYDPRRGTVCDRDVARLLLKEGRVGAARIVRKA